MADTDPKDFSGLGPAPADQRITIALLTGGGDRPYAFGLSTALVSKVSVMDVVGSDDLECAELRGKPGVTFLNLRGDQRSDVSFLRKAVRLWLYYVRLICYAATAKPGIFHILWNNKFDSFDRTLLMLYYRLLGKKVVLTVHNVNAGRRDSNDTRLNRLTLRFQYRRADHIFVHTEKMKSELVAELGVHPSRVSIIPFGINNSVPNTSLSPGEARRKLGLGVDHKTILFFGNIAPYKGLEHLTAAFRQLLARGDDYRLIIAGRPKSSASYWNAIQQEICDDVRSGRILLRADYIPDEETEIYFKAADVLLLPYTQIYQSGVLFLGYSFGLPAIATDVGSFKDDILEGITGFICKPQDPVDISRAIETYFAGDLYRTLNENRQQIRSYAAERNSWDLVGHLTAGVYATLQNGVRR